jgi:hypothetical protein
MQEFLSRATKAAKVPFGFALVFSVYAVTGGKSAAAKLNLSPYTVAGIYLAIAVFVTLLIVLFGSWANSRGRAAALGYVGAAILALILHLAIFPATDLETLTWRGVMVFMLIFGLLGAWVGFLYWEPRAKENS